MVAISSKARERRAALRAEKRGCCPDCAVDSYRRTGRAKYVSHPLHRCPLFRSTLNTVRKSTGMLGFGGFGGKGKRGRKKGG